MPLSQKDPPTVMSKRRQTGKETLGASIAERVPNPGTESSLVSAGKKGIGCSATKRWLCGAGKCSGTRR